MKLKKPKIETNGLENFGIEEDTPDLFENNSSEESSEQFQDLRMKILRKMNLKYRHF